jgi:hypothetical protein
MRELPRLFIGSSAEGLDVADLLGIIPLTYSSRRSDGNLVAALGTACNQLRRAFRANSAVASNDIAPGGPTYRRKTIDDYIREWGSPDIARSRSNIREVTLDPYSEEFQAQRADMQRIFAFLEGLADAVIEKAIDEQIARHVFEQAILSFWPVAFTMLAPANHADEWWDPPPKIAALYRHWSTVDKA